MAVMELWRRRDLEGTVKTEYVDGNFFTADSVGNLVGVKCYKDGAEATLSGSVTGYCILPSGETVSVAGTRSGNQAYILIPQSALAYTGLLGVVIKLVDGNTITTLISIIVVVYRSKTDTVITPSSQIITDWSNQIAAALQDVEDASAAQDVKINDLKSALNATDITSKFTFAGSKRTNAITGKRQDESSASSSGYVKIEGYNALVLTMRYIKMTGTAGASGIAFYSSNSESSYISGVVEPYSTQITANTYAICRIPIPDNAIYCRTTWWQSQQDQFQEIPFGCIAEKVPVYVDEYTFTARNEADDKMTHQMLGADISGLFTSWDTGYRINAVTGAKQSTYIAKASDYVDISGYQSILMTRRFITGSGGATGIAFYDSEKVFISGDTDPSDVTMETATYRIKRTDVPDGAKYVRVSWWNDDQPQAEEIVFFCVGEKQCWRSVSVEDLEDEIKRLEGADLPDYYFENNYIDERVADIKAIMADQSDKKDSSRVANDALHGGDQFFWFTDPHFYWWSTGVMNGLNSHSLIRYVKERTNIRKVFCGGDLVGSNNMSATVCRNNLKKVKAHLSDIWDDLYMLIGNHEWNNPSNDPDKMGNLLTVSEIYDLFIKDKEKDFGGINSIGDYWLDNVPQKIRYICMGINYKATFEDEQIAWLGETLLNVPAGYTVVILSHVGVNTNGGFGTTTQYVMNMLDAAKGKTSYTYGGTSYNFANFGGEIACFINGHNHRDLSRQTTGGIWVISTTCDQGPESESSEAFVSARDYNTINEQAIDVFLIDTTDKTIKTIRIGGSWDGTAPLENPDRTFSYA